MQAQNFNEDGKEYEIYCEVKIDMTAVMKTYYTITINGEEHFIADKDGNKIKTKDTTTTLNLLAKRGWKLVSSYGFSPGTSHTTQRYYTLKKVVKNDDEVLIGLVKK